MSRGSIHLVSGSVLNNFMGLSLNEHCNHNPNKVLGISLEDLTFRGPRVIQGIQRAVVGGEMLLGYSSRESKRDVML